MMDKNREAFEAWCRKTRPVLSTLKDENDYVFSDTRAAWRSWRYLTKSKPLPVGIRVKGNEE